MTQLDRLLVATAAAAMLSSCGGGDSPTPTATSTPTPTATATPTPTPTPTFSYSTFSELTGVQEFRGACESYWAEGDSLESLIITQDTAVEFDTASQTYTLRELGTAEEFEVGPAQITSQSDTATRYYLVVPSVADPSRADLYNVNVYRPEVNGQTVDYARRLYYKINRDGERPVNTDCFFGVPTLPDDLLGTDEYVFDTFNFAGGGLDLSDPSVPLLLEVIGGSGSLTIDPANQTAGLSLMYELEDSNGLRRSFGPISGTVPFVHDDGHIGFFGSVSGGPTDTDLVSGAFFGPSGAEAGLVLTLSLDLDTNAVAETTIRVLVTARR